MKENCEKPCPQCPWRLENQGKKHFGHFYTKVNLTRLWNQIRKGGAAQSCHLTDPSHPDHIAAGASEHAKIKECPGSVILVLREFKLLADSTGHIGETGLFNYLKTRKKGLTKQGILWLVSRYTQGGVPFVGGPKLPVVDSEDKEIGLPEYLGGVT